MAAKKKKPAKRRRPKARVFDRVLKVLNSPVVASAVSVALKEITKPKKRR